MSDISDILKDVGCEHLIPTFQEHEIDLDTAALLGDEELKELIPKIGPRIKFKKKILSLSQNSTNFTDLDTATSNVSDGTLSPLNVEHNTLLNTNTTEHEENQSKNAASLDGRAVLREGQIGKGLLKEGSRRKLSQLVIAAILEKDPTKSITTEEFYRLASDICEIFIKESVVVYYSAYVASTDGVGKKNASGKLYESYVSRRRRLRASGTLPSVNRVSSKSSASSETNSAASLIHDEPGVEEDSYYDEKLIWLKNNVDPWKTVEEKWIETAAHRLKSISKGEGRIEEYFKCFPALQQPQGYTLLLQDFRILYPGKEDNLFSTIILKRQEIIEYAHRKLNYTRDKYVKNKIQELLTLIDDAEPDNSTNVSLMLLPFVTNISPARKHKNKPVWKPSRAEVCDGFIAQTATEGDLTSYIISRRDSMAKRGRTLQPFVAYVGESVVDINNVYVVINNTVYGFKKLITAVDCAFKIYQATGAYYPEESEDIWTAVQIGFYNIKTKYDRNTQAVNTLLADLELLK